MKIKEAYNQWASTYDKVENKTRDLEAFACRNEISTLTFKNCLEIGCGTGKNTDWLAQNNKQVVAIDFSGDMLTIAKQKIKSNTVKFVQVDINKPWDFTASKFDLITFSLVLEHIENLPAIFKEAATLLNKGGKIYIGELHPYKQYTGSKARFESTNETVILDCYTHHLSDFIKAASENKLTLHKLNEYFDDDESTGFPRILSMVFEK
jgi:ubiquinone/menaquinone biosynthesis C-methylase UbiE